ncbi:probable G-protein coupled receptor 19 [Ylistrum balloti]|uniref:probable G-protein coupled receptor 19 n=1 Tax=Ylistrum balloti TaxID=509963 RepID=UPI002905BE4E|nr:probable G-protein coupled receptor 19 [Ylistrum balloti]
MPASNQSFLRPAGLGEDRPIIQIVPEIMILGTIWCLSIIGNLLVCIVIYRSRRVQSTTNYFVITCACADLVFVCVVIPLICGRIIMNEWLFGDFLCRCVRFVQSVFPSVTLYILASIAIDRYYTIIYPLSFKVTREIAKRMIIISCLVACLLSSFSFYFYHEVVIMSNANTSKSVCPTYVNPQYAVGAGFSISFVILQYVIPVMMIGFIYSRLVRFIWRSGEYCLRFKRTTNSVPRTKVKMLKMLIFMTIVTMVLFLPSFIFTLWVAMRSPEIMNPTIFIVCLILLLFATVAKPLIYTCYNSNFRRGCKEVFCMSSSRCYRSSTYVITTASALSKKNHVGVMKGSSDRNSPTKAFDRSIQEDKNIWPIHSGMPTTYL